MSLSRRINAIKPSPTLAIIGRALQLAAQGEDVVSFGAGEPDFDTPQNIKNAAIRAIEAGQTKYTSVDGTPELKKAILQKLERDQKLKYEPAEISVACGAKHSLYNIAQVLFDEADEVIIPAPYWVSYPDQALLAGAKPVFVATQESDGFRLTPEALQAAITKRTKALVLNSPNNPTGSAYSKSDLEKLAAVCLRNNLYIISDEIYEKVVYDDFEHFSVAQISPEVKARTLLVNGASKAYAMTGWRMGFTAGPKDIIAAMGKLQGQSTSNICSITQAACVEAFAGPQDEIKKMVVAFQERRDVIVKELNTIPGFSCRNPEGAFYVFPNVTEVLGKKTPEGKIIATSADFTAYLLDTQRVAAVSGEGFGAEGYIRLSYATSLERIREGLNRIKTAVGDLS